MSPIGPAFARDQQTVWEHVPDFFRGVAPLAIIIMGVSGSGKSTLGAELANATSAPFLEGDTFHSPEAVAKMRAGEPLTDEDRWPWLDRIGNAVKAQIANHGIVVAACSALRRSYRDHLREAIAMPVRFVLLEGARDELWRRLSSRTGHYMPASLLSSQLETLERPTPDENVIMLDAQEPPALLRDRIIEQIRKPQ